MQEVQEEEAQQRATPHCQSFQVYIAASLEMGLHRHLDIPHLVGILHLRMATMTHLHRRSDALMWLRHHFHFDRHGFQAVVTP